MSFMKKITDFVMPPISEEEEEELLEEEEAKASEKVREKARPTEAARPQRVALAGGGYQETYVSEETSESSYEDTRYAEALRTQTKPNLKVHGAKSLDMKVQIYTPTHFDQVSLIADALAAKRAVVVNYDQVDLAAQRRICDFSNGVCYAIDGTVKRVSQSIVIYVPAGVDVADVTSEAM